MNNIQGPIILSDVVHAFRSYQDIASGSLPIRKDKRFDITDIDTILYWYHHDNGGGTEVDLRFIATLRWSDGYIYVAAWNDYTGWGCQDGVTIGIHNTLDGLAQAVLEKKDRERWGL